MRIITPHIGHVPRQLVGLALTAREVEIVALVATGASSKRVAVLLGIALSTVKGHLTAIYEKTRTRNRVELVNWWTSQAAPEAA